MSHVVSFNPAHDLIYVRGYLAGPRGEERVTFVVDTGADRTFIAHEYVYAVGYSARDGESIASFSSAIGREHGYRLRVRRLEVLGEVFSDFQVVAADIAENANVQGLLGLDVLRHFNVEILFKQGLLRVARA